MDFQKLLEKMFHLIELNPQIILIFLLIPIALVIQFSLFSKDGIDKKIE